MIIKLFHRVVEDRPYPVRAYVFETGPHWQLPPEGDKVGYKRQERSVFSAFLPTNSLWREMHGGSPLTTPSGGR